MDSQESHSESVGAARADDIMEAFARAQRAFPPPLPTTVTAAGRLSAVVRLARCATRYWWWRIKGRPRRAEDANKECSQVIYNYETELSRAHGSITALENRLAERAAHAARFIDLETRAAAAELRAAEAEEAARTSAHKVELLKDALEGARARAAAPAAADTKFREAKRAFARLFHPDQGGDPLRTQFFQEFWQVLEKIDKGE